MILTEENVMTVQCGTVVMVLNPQTDMYVECTLETVSGELVYLMTTDSDVAAGNLPGNSYRAHVHHFRANDSYEAVMAREAMAHLLINRQYTIE